MEAFVKNSQQASELLEVIDLEVQNYQTITLRVGGFGVICHSASLVWDKMRTKATPCLVTCSPHRNMSWNQNLQHVLLVGQ